MKVLLLSFILTLFGVSNAITPNTVNPVETDCEITTIVATDDVNSIEIEGEYYIVKVAPGYCEYIDPNGVCTGFGTNCAAAWEMFRDCICQGQPNCDMPDNAPPTN